jgi:hypothetical protein
LAGIGLPGTSTVTAHLDKVEGAVIVFADEPHELTAIEQARIAVNATKVRRR